MVSHVTCPLDFSSSLTLCSASSLCVGLPKVVIFVPQEVDLCDLRCLVLLPITSWYPGTTGLWVSLQAQKETHVYSQTIH